MIPIPSDELSALALDYVAALGELEQTYFRDPDGAEGAQRRTALVDHLVVTLFARFFPEASASGSGLALCAVGGYGRGELFPCSDVDLLFVSEQPPGDDLRSRLRGYLQTLWDAHLRVSHSLRTSAECAALHEGNAEFTISILDLRPLNGDLALVEKLRHELLPRMIRRERAGLLKHLEQLIRERHQRFSDTLYHLEPNIKDAPGGLRDLQAQAWWRTLQETTQQLLPQEARWPAEQREPMQAAHRFLAMLRTFLHYQHGRDINIFSYDMQERLGTETRWGGPRQSPQAWMRAYFTHARWIEDRLQRLLHASASRRSSLLRFVQQRRHEFSTADFAVTSGGVNFRNARFAEHDPTLAIDVFRIAAEHHARLSDAAEATLQHLLPRLRSTLPERPESWAVFRRLLVSRGAYAALTAMHRLGVLNALVPEFAAIDGYVLRDFHHRYTVDEHSLLTIKMIHDLGEADAGRPFAQIYRELERPDLLLFALLLHDVGKGAGTDDHLTPGAAAADEVMSRWRFGDDEREHVRFLIQQHLALSQAMRRDIFDPETVQRAAAVTATEERLKLLTLLTLADIRAVQPEAMTPWKEENLWQLYMAVCGRLARGIEENRIGGPELDPAASARELLAQVHAEPVAAADLAAFLDGLPRRYLASCAPRLILEHFYTACDLGPGEVRALLHHRRSDYEVSVLAHDRPGLFAAVAGILAGFGVSIVKAEAFANARGIVVDHFRFADHHRNLELNEGEGERLRRQLETLLAAGPRLDQLRGPARRWFARQSGPPVETRLGFQQDEAGRHTLLELVTRDRPGLLFDISRIIAQLGCDIHVALIDTEASRAIDVFYLTHQGGPLNEEQRGQLRQTLTEALALR